MLFSGRFILTAAHCILGRKVFVRIGDHDKMSDKEDTELIQGIAKTHPEWQSGSGAEMAYDFAVIK